MKIGSVKIEREVFAQVFTKYGIEELVAEIKFPQADVEKPFAKSITAVKRVVKQHMGKTKKDRIAFLQSCEPTLTWMDDTLAPDKERALRMFSATTSSPASVPSDFVWNEEVHKYPAYLPLFRTIKKTYHETSRTFKRDARGETPIHLLDYESYAAELILKREVRRFAATHPEAVKYALLKRHSDNRTFYPLHVMNESLREKLVDVAKEYEFTIDDQTKPLYKTHTDYGYNELFDGDVSGIDVQADYSNNLVGVLIGEFLRYMGTLRKKAVDRSIERAAYAKAFQTKKHIPKTHQEKMTDNVFLESHGYVELDEDVDLNKFAIVEEDYAELRRYFPYPRDESNSFRIKKLGNYRAGGIYFVAFNATIFDINSVSSFVHEVFHQLDYTFRWTREKGTDALHEGTKFRHVYEMYKHFTEENVNSLKAGDPFLVQWRGSTKFNKHYFLDEAEVFARLGEIVIASIGDPENGLHKNLDELGGRPEYPTHPDLIEAAKRYFAEVLPFIKLTNGVV